VGYSSSFSFDVTGFLVDGVNTVYVRVESPWDYETAPGSQSMRCFSVKRRMVKGTYEHADGFIQRDVNPIGIIGPVRLRTYAGGRLSFCRIHTEIHDAVATVSIDMGVDSISGSERIAGTVCDATGHTIHSFVLPAGQERSISFQLESFHTWESWERGEPYLYRCRIELKNSNAEVLEVTERFFGIRTAELVRTKQETRFLLNGRRMFLRGTSYFPDVYTQDISRERYERDLRNMKSCGFNAIRVHVHVEQDCFYELCDRMGFIVFQDSDFSWNHPSDASWLNQAFTVFDDMVEKLFNHPSVCCWILLNEPDKWKTLVSAFGTSLEEIASQADSITQSIGRELVSRIRRLDPWRPYIRASYDEDDPESGDSHNYLGSLRGEKTQYTDIDGTVERLNTEFGMDVPGCWKNLSAIPELRDALYPVLDRLPEIQRYQYKLLKYYMEHYRRQKYRPCSGYFQFMFIDLCPQSFYGVYDWWGDEKPGLQALLESNQPVVALAVSCDDAVEVSVVNDLDTPVSGVLLWRWELQGLVVSEGSLEVACPADSLGDMGRIPMVAHGTLRLTVTNLDGMHITENVYQDAFEEKPHIVGHPLHMDNELGMRIYR
jgi:beta-mannosidase